MSEFYEIDFLGVESAKSGDAITVRYKTDGREVIHVVDGGYLDTGEQIVSHLQAFYNNVVIDHVVLTHPDQDHANGLRTVLEQCTVRNLWINRPWMYATELLPRFSKYNSADALARKLRDIYSATAELERIATEREIPVHSPLQGATIGEFTVLAPSLHLIGESHDSVPQINLGKRDLSTCGYEQRKRDECGPNRAAQR
jgi:ribonuclease BN (tRNA processing enzyme)